MNEDESQSMSKLLVFDEKKLQEFRKLVVFGDIHGDYKALESALHILDPAKDGIIFLGDYADRGLFGVEVIETITSLMRNHPRNVFPLKGNHEDYTESGTPSFYPHTLIYEVAEKRGNWRNYFHDTLRPFINNLHIAAIVPGEILFVHGGISSKIKSVNDFKNPTKDIENDILWSDPFEGYGEYPNLERGVGVEFGMDVSNTVCKLLDVKKIIRSHQPQNVLNGPVCSHNYKVVTTSSTSVYNGKPFFLSIQPPDLLKIQVEFLGYSNGDLWKY